MNSPSVNEKPRGYETDTDPGDECHFRELTPFQASRELQAVVDRINERSRADYPKTVDVTPLGSEYTHIFFP